MTSRWHTARKTSFCECRFRGCDLGHDGTCIGRIDPGDPYFTPGYGTARYCGACAASLGQVQ